MTSRWLLPVGALAVVGILGLAVWQGGERAVTSAPAETAGSTLGETLQEPVAELESFMAEGGPIVHPVSLPALFAKDFDGRDLTLGRVLADNEAYTQHYITYKSGELTISGIMNVPKGEGPFPVLILNHGYIDPAVYTNGRGLRREQDYLARRGYVVLHSDYRNHADSSKDPDNDVHFRLGYVEDVINAVRAVQNSDFNFIDGERIGMLGHSMGGGVTLGVLTVQPELVDAAVLFAPVSGDQRDNFRRWIERRPETARRIIDQFGRAENNPDFWDNVSPQTFYDRIEAPVLIHHGTVDDSVPLEWSNKLAERLEAHDIDMIYHTYTGEPHEFIDAWPTVMQRTVQFFDQYLK